MSARRDSVIWVEMKPPGDTRVWVNGEEIPQSHIRSVSARHEAGEVPVVTVELIGGTRVHAHGRLVEEERKSPLDEPAAPYS